MHSNFSRLRRMYSILESIKLVSKSNKLKKGVFFQGKRGLVLLIWTWDGTMKVGDSQIKEAPYGSKNSTAAKWYTHELESKLRSRKFE